MTVNLNALDDMGSLLSTSASGATQDFAYTPFGSPPTRGNSQLPGFNGERPDPVSQTYHLGNGYRTYNPILMRFNAPDSWSPFGAGGLNQYAYCEGDPINRADPSGHMSWQAGVGLGLGILGILGAVFTFGQSLTAAAAAEAAITASMAADLMATGLGVAASVTSVASAATEESNPEASRILGWVSFGLGIPGAISGMANFGKTIYSKLNGRASVFNLAHEAFELPEISYLPNAGINPHHSRALSFNENLSAMSDDFVRTDARARADDLMQYLSISQREGRELEVRNGGLLYRKTGALPNRGFYEYVYSADGKLYINNGIAHSQILSGEAVQCAGMAFIQNGRILSIDNESGHYRPTNEKFVASMKKFFDSNFITSTTLVSVRGNRPIHAGKLLNKWATLV